MDITGKIIFALPETNGVSKAGNAWKKREYVLQTFDTYPKSVHFDFFGEKADQFPLSVGDTVKLYFDIESREYNGKWYTSIRGWKAEPATATVPGAEQMGAPAAATAPMASEPPIPITPEPGFIADSSDDLPF